MLQRAGCSLGVGGALGSLKLQDKKSGERTKSSGERGARLKRVGRPAGAQWTTNGLTHQAPGLLWEQQHLAGRAVAEEQMLRENV